jgi:hypothetical protein
MFSSTCRTYVGSIYVVDDCVYVSR